MSDLITPEDVESLKIAIRTCWDKALPTSLQDKRNGTPETTAVLLLINAVQFILDKLEKCEESK